MRKEPFVILGISPDSTQSEILAAYKAKRAELEQKRFLEGEAGADAARQLSKLDAAYQAAMDICHSGASISEEEQDLDYNGVKVAIKAKNFDEAQRLLDGITYRDAEWHYLQSVIFYNKNRLVDSKKQLEIAVSMDETNDKYKQALENIKNRMNGQQPFNQTNGQQFNQNGQFNQNTQDGYQRTYQQNGGQRSTGDSLCDACSALWCADCCCECMGGDLIRCC